MSAGGCSAGKLLLQVAYGLVDCRLDAVRSVLPLAEPHERAALMGVFYIESYLANSVPTIAVGYLAQRAGLLTAVNVYGAVLDDARVLRVGRAMEIRMRHAVPSGLGGDLQGALQ